MTTTNGPGKVTSRKTLASPRRNLLKQATKLAKVVNSKNVLDANGIFAMEKDIDIPKLEKAIARCRRAIALQTRILDELEAEVKEIKRDAQRNTPATSKKRK